MSDTRPRVTPDKLVNLAQLDVELGGVGLSRNDETGEIVAPESVTQQQLDDAVAAHEAVFPPSPDDEFRAAVDAASDIQSLKAALLGAAGPGAQARQPTR